MTLCLVYRDTMDTYNVALIYSVNALHLYIILSCNNIHKVSCYLGQFMVEKTL